jgi:hypothetical protein
MNELLSQVKIASPCRARWEDMTGDDRSRFCGRCEKHVYNFSAMTAAEAEDLIRAKEGKLCGRYYRRKDGTMLTANCPVGKRAYFVRVKALVATAVTLLFASLGVMASSRGEGGRGPLAQKRDEWLWTVKGWLGLNPKPVLMGSMCVTVPAPPPPAPQNSGKGTDSSGNQGEKAAQP